VVNANMTVSNGRVMTNSPALKTNGERDAPLHANRSQARSVPGIPSVPVTSVFVTFEGAGWRPTSHARDATVEPVPPHCLASSDPTHNILT
jgi:hypothetical protein